LLSGKCGADVNGSDHVVGEDERAISVLVPFSPLVRKRAPAIILLIVPKGCSTAHRLALIIAGVARASMRLSASSSRWRLSVRRPVAVQRVLSQQSEQSGEM
jgi:hypothetical protein